MIFADSSFLIAFMIERDRYHDVAVKLYEEVAGKSIVTTNHIRGETWTWMRTRSWHARAVAFLDSIGGPGQRIRVARLEESEEDEALLWLRQHDEREYSFVDATSFAFMRARGIEEALAFDGDFAAAGFTELHP